MKSTTRLDSAVFQLTPTRTRCDLYIIANDKKEKIASGLLNPFIAHLKAAQDQIAEGGYSVLLAPEPGTNATWFTKCTVESFVRFVSTPEILERVYTIESEILQIEEAIAIQGNNEILCSSGQIEDQHVASSEGSKPTYDANADEDKAIVLYKPETTVSSAKEGNSKVELLNVLETRKNMLKKEQGMAFARATAAGFEIEHLANLLSFAECFGASRLMNGCLRFMDIWKQKHESGQWVEVEPEVSAEAHYSMLSNIHNDNDATSGTDPNSNSNSVGGQLPLAWSPGTGGAPVYQPYGPYPVPYYPFYPPPPPPYAYPSMDININNNNNNNNDSPEQHNNVSGKKKSNKVVIRNINFINSKKTDNSSESASDSGDETDAENDMRLIIRSPKRKGGWKESETENGHWDAFQTYLLKGAAEGENETKRNQKSMVDDPLANAERDDDGVYRNVNDDFMIGRREEANVRNGNDDFMIGRNDEAVMISMRGVNENNNTSSSMNMEVKYEPDALSLMPERDVEKRSIGYDPALDYEMQSSSALREKKTKTQVKKVTKSAEKQQPKKVKPSKVNNISEDARARAEKLRAYKADLQKMKKQQQEAEMKRLEALKMERQKRIAARAKSKFTDSEPGLTSPLQRSKIRPAASSVGSTNSRTRLTRSLSDAKKDMNSVTPAVVRRLSEPRNNSSASIHTRSAASIHTKSAETVSRSRKISSSAVGIGQSKTAEVKMKTSKVSSNVTQKVNVNVKEKAVIDKSVVMVENKQQKASSNHGIGVVKVVDKAVHPPPPPVVKVVDKHPTSTSTTCSEVRKTCVEEKEREMEKDNGKEKGGEYEAPYARASSFEDPSTRNSDYAKAPPPSSNFETTPTEKAFVVNNNLKLEKILEKPTQPKGFRRLLKLGKKNNSPSSEPQPQPQVQTLKTLISQHQTSQKSSRHLSLLSSLRGGKKPSA